MDEDKLERIKSLNQSETEVLRYLLDDPNFKVRDLANEIYRGEGGIRTNLTNIFAKLGVPKDVTNKREWVIREYKEASQRLESQPEIFIKPPDPVMIYPAEASEPSRGLEMEEVMGKLEKMMKDAVVMDWETLRWVTAPHRRTVRLWVFLLGVFLAFILGFYLALVVTSIP